jgi:Holliday junction resolvase RusA-like endonuclease
MNKSQKMIVFTPSRHNVTSFSNCIKKAIAMVSPNNPFDIHSGNPVSITVQFYFKRPMSHFQQGHLKHDAPMLVTKNPDIDNLCKLVMDSLQGIIYKNDNVVCQLSAKKYWLGNRKGGLLKYNTEKYECTIIKITEHKTNKIAPK